MNHIPPHDPAFGTLLRFLGSFDLSATAHAREALTTRQQTMISTFARGELDESSRKELIPLLSANATALEFLVRLLKSPDS